jgi:flagellin-specific chaperone FliS
MEETSEGVLEEMEEITSSVKPSDPSSSSEELTMLFDEDTFHMNIAIDIVENDDLSVENEFINALNEIDGLTVYPCNICNKICKSKGGLTKHKNSKHVDDGSGTSEGSNTTPLDKDTMNSIVNTIKQNIIDEKLYGDEIESSIKNVTATEALFNEVEPLYSKFCKNKNQDKLLKSFYGLMLKPKVDDSLADSHITNLVMIHIPDHLISFYNISGRGDASVTTTENTTKECEKIEACKMGPLSYIAGYVVRKLTNARKKKTESENTELQGLLRSLQSEQENNSFIQARNRGGLVNPSDDLIGILQEAEINFRREVNKSKEVLRNIPVDVICYKTISMPIVNSLWDNIVVSSRVNPSGDTQKLCLENIVKLFLKVRSFSYDRNYITQYKIREKQRNSKALRKDLKNSELS